MITRTKGEKRLEPARDGQFTSRAQDVIRRAVALYRERTGSQNTPDLPLLMEWLLVEAKRK